MFCYFFPITSEKIRNIININILKSQIFPLLCFVVRRHFNATGANGQDIIKRFLGTCVLLTSTVSFKANRGKRP